MIHKLPRWVWAGAWALAFGAGVVNVVGILGFELSTVASHRLGYSALFITGGLAVITPIG